MITSMDIPDIMPRSQSGECLRRISVNSTFFNVLRGFLIIPCLQFSSVCGQLAGGQLAGGQLAGGHLAGDFCEGRTIGQ